MRTAMALAATLLPLSISNAAFTDFADRTQTEVFQTGDVFESNGLVFKAIELRPLDFQTQISIGPNVQALLPAEGVEFLLAPGIQEISLYYVDGAGSALSINGVEPPYRGGGIFNDGLAGFSYFHGMTVGGVNISTSVLTQSSTTHNGQQVVSHETGVLTLAGPINSFSIAGIELSIDNVLVRVPEPGSCALAAIVATTIAGYRRRH